MSSSEAITSISLQSLPKLSQGKVRDLFDLDASTLLFTATDRISAYDVVLANGVPQKGLILTQISAHWFSVLEQKVPGLKHHLLSLSAPASAPLTPEERSLLRGRTMTCRKLKVFPIEAIVRGYITGSAWSEYVAHGTVHGIPQPAGLEKCGAFPNGPIYTPSTKAPAGEKDENISPEQAVKIVGEKYAARIAELSLSVYSAAAAYARERGIIVADTKFEFALDEATDEVVLVDEVLTPYVNPSQRILPPAARQVLFDSSRFWNAAEWKAGVEAPSYDKQFVRDYLTSNGLKGKPDVELPEAVVKETAAKYQDVFEKLTGKTLDQALAALDN
ncbi:phosphoribosylaminoimidazole-succinocarboxamide synthase [Trichoderma asperellum]|uniref:Phosphoribosylaminoimidazole-succinocarboxamide synthase n=1 Tax=Trichoderma asperellum TaxID=101201 RepID=A0A6V8QNP4_TRIAP|nr:phosphoribosylaminoimidazole-succinocarboxamide synthase [Trichoderma asperellum]